MPASETLPIMITQAHLFLSSKILEPMPSTAIEGF